MTANLIAPAEAELPFVPYAPKSEAPEWTQDREFTKAKRRKKRLTDRVTNPCKCYSYAATGQTPKTKSKNPDSAIDLCQCQVRLAFELAYPDHHLAEDCRGLFGLDCDEVDREHIEWVVCMNLAEWMRWMPDADQATFALIEDPTTLTVLEVFAVIRAARDWKPARCAEEAELQAARRDGGFTLIRTAREALAVREHQQVWLDMGLTLNAWDNCHGEAWKRREASKHSTH